MVEGSFLDGKPDGMWTYWFPNGQKKEEGNPVSSDSTSLAFLNDGIWTFWHANGQMKETGTYINGEKDGPWTEWYDNGQVKLKESYKNKKSKTNKKYNFFWSTHYISVCYK